MRLVIKSLNGKKVLSDSGCDNVVSIASAIMDFLNSQLCDNSDAEFIKFSCVVKREVKQDEIAFDYSPTIITFD